MAIRKKEKEEFVKERDEKCGLRSDIECTDAVQCDGSETGECVILYCIKQNV